MAEKTQKHKFYEVKGGKLARRNKICPRCGGGVFLAEHKNRRACGVCGYTEWKKEEKKKE